MLRFDASRRRLFFFLGTSVVELLQEMVNTELALSRGNRIGSWHYSKIDHHPVEAAVSSTLFIHFRRTEYIWITPTPPAPKSNNASKEEPQTHHSQ